MTTNFLDKIKNAAEVKAKLGSRGGKSTIALGMVHNKNGMRISLTNGLYSELGSPKTIQFSSCIDEEQRLLFLGEKLPNVNISYTPTHTNKAIVYNAGLVKQITEEFDLCYDDVTSKSFKDIDFQDVDGYVVAIIHMPLEKPATDN